MSRWTRLGSGLALVLAVVSAQAWAACDPTGVDAPAISAGRDAIDDACPCAPAASRGGYRRCATAVVNGRVATNALARGCRRDTLKHAKLSICGRPGAVVCCRVSTDGRQRDRVVSMAPKCVNTHSLVACVSSAQSVPTGCDSTGCIPPPICGNGVVEPGEDCDPPDAVFCSFTCRSLACEPPATTCGNGTIDPGEGCEPPGIGTCTDDCRIATCPAPAAGEIGVACDVYSAGVAVAATASTYVVAWSDGTAAVDVVARRFDANGAPLDPTRTVLSAGEGPCSFHGDPALASDGQDFYAVWNASGLTEFSTFYSAMFGRRIGGTTGIGPRDQLALATPVGQCQVSIDAPMTAAGVSPARFAVGWRELGGCFNTPIFQDPVGQVVDFTASPTPQSFAIGIFPPAPPPSAASQSAAGVAQLAADTLWTWHLVIAPTDMPPFEYAVAGVFTDLAGEHGITVLSHRTARIGGRPAVAAGASSFLVAWSQGASDAATTDTEIRAVRATRAAGRLDADGGLLLATTATAITGGPVVAFDGTRWLVVWAEQSGATNDLRAVAVAADGTIVDASPRLVASDVVAASPAAASTGGGRVLVVFARPDGTTRDVRATLVTP